MRTITILGNDEVKVLTAPENYQKWWWNRLATCGNCTTQIEFLPGAELSVNFIPMLERGGEKGIAYHCPTCGERIAIWEKK